MFNARTLSLSALLCVAALNVAAAENTTISLSSMVANGTSKAIQTGNAGVNRAAQAGGSMVPFTVHAGAMVTPRGAGLAGGDIDIPSVSLLKGFTGRLDADVIFKANFGGVNTITIVTLDQISTTQNGLQGHNVYYGGGVGAIFGGGNKFDGKLILGSQITNKVSTEVNVHFSTSKTLVSLLARIHI